MVLGLLNECKRAIFLIGAHTADTAVYMFLKYCLIKTQKGRCIKGRKDAEERIKE